MIQNNEEQKNIPNTVQDASEDFAAPHYPIVQISDHGKAIVIDPDTPTVQPKFLGGITEDKKKYVLLGIICFSILLGICILAFSRDLLYKLMPKESLSALKIQHIRTLETNENTIVFTPRKAEEYNASFVAPLNFMEEQVSEDDSVYMKLKTADDSLFLILHIIPKTEAPVELRTFHRLTFENIVSEFDAQVSGLPTYFTTDAGNKAFETRLYDRNYEYYLITVSSETAFATLMISSEISQRKVENELSRQIATEIARSLYIE
ncbi:MAG: hypothetical protein EOM59_01320 [Clostridia bacterium]|nr:hypothetical protein [Clostridia bacterium]